MKAIWNDTLIAESNDTLIIEGNHYFPRESVKSALLVDSSTHTNCPWKGQASYFNISAGGKTNKDVAWYYPSAKPMAKKIEGYVAFWKGVEIID